MNFLLKHKWTLIGIAAGAIGGFLYWQYVGCDSGQCAITSKPFNSSAYGAMMGGLLFSTFKKEKKGDTKGDNE